MLEEIKPRVNYTSFTIKFSKEWLDIENQSGIFYGNYIILTTPKKKWYKRLLQFLSFGIYKAPWEYKVKPI